MSNGRHELCYILPEYDPDTNTHFAYLYKLIRNVQNRLDIFLITEKTPTDDTGRPTADPKELGTTRSVLLNKDNYLLRLFAYLWHIWRASSQGYKDVYVHYSFIGALTAIFVTSLRGGRVFYWNCGMPWLYERNWFRERVFRFILRRTILVTGTQSLAKEYTDRYGLDTKNTRVFPNWIDVDEFQSKLIENERARNKLDIPEGKKVILFVHHLSRRKGVDKIIPTLEQMDRDDLLFVVLGEGPLLDELQEYAQNGAKADKLRVEGRVPHSQVHQYLSATDVFFMPSEEEGFPHVLLEAMAADVPYVATDVGGVRDISPDCEQEFIVTSRTPQNFADALVRIINNPPSGEKIESHLRENYDFSKARKVYLSLFNEG